MGAKVLGAHGGAPRTNCGSTSAYSLNNKLSNFKAIEFDASCPARPHWWRTVAGLFWPVPQFLRLQGCFQFNQLVPGNGGVLTQA